MQNQRKRRFHDSVRTALDAKIWASSLSKEHLRTAMRRAKLFAPRVRREITFGVGRGSQRRTGRPAASAVTVEPKGSHPRRGGRKGEGWVVGRLGFEPRTNNLKGCCSTIELSPHWTQQNAGNTFRQPELASPFWQAPLHTTGYLSGKAPRALHPGPILPPWSHRCKIVGTFEYYSRQKETERMSTKAEEVALDRLLVDRFKQGDSSAFDEMVGYAEEVENYEFAARVRDINNKIFGYEEEEWL